jgi:hypothetical protein
MFGCHHKPTESPFLRLPVTWAPVSMLAMRRQACSYVEAKDTCLQWQTENSWCQLTHHASLHSSSLSYSSSCLAKACLIALAFSKMAATLVFVTDWTTGSFCFSLRRRLKDWTSTWVYEFRKLQTRNLVLTYL